MNHISWFKNKKVFITGHTGFKGAWLTRMLVDAGAEVTGFALKPMTDPSLFELLHLEKEIHHVEGDVRDLAALKAAFDEAAPEIVLHLAAQPIVRTSYQEPVYTYETNVMGTVHICECVRQSKTVRSFLNVTTDKVYENKEWCWGYREDEPLDGYDPYSNSKSCSELVTHSYINSFFRDLGIAASTARAGNVIGGGDFAPDRILPDCVRAAMEGSKIVVRNPYSTRPYQHVLEPLSIYLMIAGTQYEDPAKAGFYNVGPDERDCVNTAFVVEEFCRNWGENLTWINQSDGGPHEANFLKLDCSKLKTAFGWQPRWSIGEAIARTVEWTKAYVRDPKSVLEVTRKQIEEFSGK